MYLQSTSVCALSKLLFEYSIFEPIIQLINSNKDPVMLNRVRHIGLAWASRTIRSTCMYREMLGINKLRRVIYRFDGNRCKTKMKPK